MRGPDSPPAREPYARAVGNIVLVFAAVVALGISQFARPKTFRRLLPAPAPKATVTPLAVAPLPVPVKPEPPAPVLDREAVTQAEGEVEAARRERGRAESRLNAAKDALATATTHAAGKALSLRSLASRLRDPSPRITRATVRAGALRADRDRLQEEIASLARAPRPKGKALIDKSPVARPADGEEFHFEVRRGRIAPIDLERLLTQVKLDARLQLRRSEGLAATIRGRVGPVGAFAMQYELGRSSDDPLNLHSGSFGLQAWEIVPEQELRGESLDDALAPASDFTRSINRLNPQRSTVTMWVYPDGFALYRKVREVLHARGFQVAARPMPESLPIRGSPSGTVSAGQ